MRRGVRAWVNKAETDHRVARRESRVRLHRPHDVICFHAQQCAEKYLKAVLVESAVPVPRTHNLILIWSLLPPGGPFPVRPSPGLARLTVAAVEYRYPGRAATARQSREAIQVMDFVRTLCRAFLGLPV